MLKAMRDSAPPWLQSAAPYVALLGIVAVTLATRIPGVWHAPGSHPDERHMVSVVLGLSWNDLNPRSFAYGSLSYYTAFFAGQTIAWLFPSLRAGTDGGLSYDHYFVLGRSLGVIYGTLTVIATYFLAYSIYQQRLVALLASFLLATNLLHVQLSRFFTSDILLTLLTTVTLLCIIKISKTSALRWYFSSGVLFGLALATKISAVYLGAPLLVALIITWRSGVKLRTIALYGSSLVGTALVALMITQPFMYRGCDSYQNHDPSKPSSSYLLCNEFLRQTTEQIHMVQGKWRPPYTVQYVNTSPFTYALHQMFHYTMGWPVALAVLVGTALALYRLCSNPFSAEAILLSWTLVVFLATAGLTVKFPRYLLPIYPTLLVLAARALIPKTKSLIQDTKAHEELSPAPSTT